MPLITSAATPRLRPTLVGLAEFGDGSLVGATLTIFDTATMQQLFLGGRAAYTDAWVTARDGVSQTELRDQVAPLLPAGVVARTDDDVAQESQDAIGQALGFVTTFLLVFAGVALVVGSFLIINTFSILVTQRSPELAPAARPGREPPAGHALGAGPSGRPARHRDGVAAPACVGRGSSARSRAVRWMCDCGRFVRTRRAVRARPARTPAGSQQAVELRRDMVGCSGVPTTMQGSEDPDGGGPRLAVQIVCGDPQNDPALHLEQFLPPDVAGPLPRVGAVVLALVLDGDPVLGIAEVWLCDPPSVLVAGDRVDHGFGQAREHQQETQPGLGGRVDAVAHVAERRTGQTAAVTAYACGSRQIFDGAPVADQRVPGRHQGQGAEPGARLGQLQE